MIKNKVYGIILIIIGILLLLKFCGILTFNIFFDGWWTLFIIVPSFVDLFKKGNLASSSLGLSIGVLLLLASQDIISWKNVGQIFLPIVIIVIGLSLIFKSSHKKDKTKSSEKYIAVFSGCEEKVKGEFKSSSIISVFGGVDLDLTKAQIKEDIIIDVLSIFGGADIRLPENVNVKTSGVPVFGGIENKYVGHGKNTVYINYICIFGGVDLL